MKRLSYVLIILLLASFLAACGGDQETAEEPAQPAAEEPDAAPPAGEQPAGEAETAAEEETMAPTATAEPEPTATEPTAEEEQSDAMAAGAEETPAVEEETAEEAATSGGGWGESGTGAQSACDHPYLPMREGATWTYDTGDGSYTWEVTSVEGDLQEATAEVVVTLDEITLNYEWNCVAGQGISSVDFAGQGLASTLPEMTVELKNAEGQFLPPAEEMTEGATWDSTFEQEVTVLMGEGDEQLEVGGTSTTEQTSTILSTGPVSAAGVTVDGVRVEQVSDITMMLAMMGQELQQTMALTNVFDMGWGVGIMHQEVDSEFEVSAVDLTSFYVP